MGAIHTTATLTVPDFNYTQEIDKCPKKFEFSRSQPIRGEQFEN